MSLPEDPIQRMTSPITKFLRTESAGGIVLLIFTALALVMANSPFSSSYLAFWNTPISLKMGAFEFSHSLRHWINDGLMSLFFFVVGLEVKREMVHGELSSFRKASLPIVAALGGMIVPSGIYLALQGGREGADGWGMVMATDIAFVVGCMSLVGKNVPKSLKIFLLTLAIVDDIGAILVIAIGYTSKIALLPLVAAGVLSIVIVLLLRLGIRSRVVFILMGLGVWGGFHESGVHATLAGVLLGLLTPVSPWMPGATLTHLQEHLRSLPSVINASTKLRDTERATRLARSPLERTIETLHPWVSFGIMPLFALANAGVALKFSMLESPITIAVVAGLFIGKPLGITLFSFAAVKLGAAALPRGVTWPMVCAGGVLAGIGFTMSLFIAGLGLTGQLLQTAKAGILLASTMAAAFGVAALFFTTRQHGAALAP